jgi:hypothetical protein
MMTALTVAAYLPAATTGILVALACAAAALASRASRGDHKRRVAAALDDYTWREARLRLQRYADDIAAARAELDLMRSRA